jgi:uncharacterized protein (UPF0335 family)
MSFLSNLLRTRTTAVIFSVLGVGYAIRAVIVNFAIDDFKQNDKRKQQEVKDVFQNLKRLGSDPQIDWERVWIKVLQEEERISKEEEEGSPVPTVTLEG